MQLSADFGTGGNPPAGWRSLREVDLLILVGLTGVGKSTTLEELAAGGLAFRLAPDRRLLTDELIISHMQQLAGESVEPVRDRKARFDYTRQYREHYPGGMAHALSHLWVDARRHRGIHPEMTGMILFDGLRGVNEVEHAAELLPQARFVALTAPDSVRVRRLLGRNEHFDQIQTGQGNFALHQTHSAESLSGRFPTAANLRLTDHEQAGLLSLIEKGEITSDALEAKLAIVSEERRNYDPEATLTALQSVAADRLCVVDTVTQNPNQCARQIIGWIQ